MTINFTHNRSRTFLTGSLLLLMMMLSLVSNAQISQNFGSSTFPPSGWDVYSPGGMTIRSSTVNGYAASAGMGSVNVGFYNYFSDIDSLRSPVLTPTIAGDTIIFDHAHIEYPGYADSMAIYVSSNSGNTWTRLSGLVGSSANPLPAVTLSTVPGGGTGWPFNPNSSQWATKRFGLPVGTDRVTFIFYSTFGNDMYLDNIMVTRNLPMVYDSTAAVQITDTVFQGMQGAAVIDAQVYTTYTANALPVTAFYGSTSGCTSTSDITRAKLYYTGSAGGFNPATAILLGTVNNPSGNFAFTGFNQTLAGGTSHFWIVYDVSPNASVGDVLDATFDSIKVNGIGRIPTIKNPTGSRYIKSYFTYSYCNFGVLYVGSYLIGPTNVTFGTINNTTADYDKVTNYSNQINSMYKGDSARVFVTIGPGNNEQVGIFVDWNNNGQFDLPSEEVYYASNVTAAGTTSLPTPTTTSPIGYIKVPCSASNGYHRMRVVSDWYGAPRVDPCSTKYYGDGEDYTIEVKDQPNPIANFSAVDTFYTSGFVVSLNTSVGSNMTYEWDYNNDGTYDGTTKDGYWQYTTNGTYFAKMRVTSTGCNGILRDSITKKIVIVTPPAATTANFISDKNVVSTTDVVTFYDLSTYGPGTWSWSISPSNVNGNPAFNYVNGTNNSKQNPQVQFLEYGKYTVTLTATNVLGSNTVTKTYYINCVRSLNMCSGSNTLTTTEDAGFLYDDGGKNGNYTAGHYASSGGQCTLLIKPGCAAKVSLKFKSFDMSIFQTPGGDFLKVYDGTSATGTPLHTSIGWPAGIQNLVNNVAWLPPTLVANSGAMYIEYWTDAAFQAKGFEAEWSTTPIVGTTPPTASFNVPDTIYTGVANTYICTATGAGNSYDWDFNNDGIYDASGASVSYNYASATNTTVKCVISSCLGSTTVSKTVKVLDPTVAPTPLFTANFTNGTPVDVFQLIDASKNGPTSWQWTITPATYNLVTGTNSTQNVSVKFTATGTYTVKLRVANAFGADSLTKTNYLRVFYYCTPNVNQMNPDIGISNVTFGAINNTTSQGVVGYSDYTNLATSNFELGGVYPITIKRTTNTNAINRKVWIDLNGDGDFIDAGEMLYQEASSTTLSVTGNITIPITATLGATRLRVGVNTASLPNLGCGANFFGEFEDYRVNITPDITKPVITLTGSDTVYVEVGYVFTDPGATATDNVTNPQTFTATYNGFTNGTAIATVGTYTITYTAVDNTGNQAVTKTRVVIVTPDVTKPVITLNGADTMVVAVGTSFTDPGATANDYYFGPVTPVTVLGSVNINVVANYSLFYSATDIHGNPALAKLRVVQVVDTVKPVITVNGANPLLWDVHRKPFVDPGVTVTDNYCTSNLNAIGSPINVDSLGTYTITYIFKDCNNNSAISKTRTVIVQDTAKPVLTFAQGTDTFLIDVKTLTVVPEPGYTISDNYYANSQLTVSKTGTVNLNVLGSYPVTYTVTDPSANTSKANVRVYKVVDRVKPVISLIGYSVQNIYRWQIYNDSGATITDNYYTTLIPVVGGFVDVNLAGIYYLTFNVTDPSGNVADEVRRLINVKESIGGIATSEFEKGLNVYPNPNTGAFTLEVKLNDAKEMNIAIYDMLGNKVKDLANDKISTATYNFDLSTLAAGNYMIKFTTENETVSKKLTIIKN